MHLGNGAITPECAAVTYSAAAAGLAASAAALRANRPTMEKLGLAAGLGCAVFAAQAINVPVAAGMSGHLVGGVLLAWALGPALGAWTMALVLLAQATLLGDGGMAALGANVINMALLPTAIFAMAKRPSVAGVPGLALTAALSVVLAAALIVAESAAFRPAGEATTWSAFAARMIVNHLWIGSLEGLATAAIFALAAATARQRVGASRLAIGLAAAVFFAAAIVPFSSSLPDGYEAAAEQSGLAWLLSR